MTVREYFFDELKMEEWRPQTEGELIDSLIDSHRTLRNYRLEQDKKNKEKLDEQAWTTGYPTEKGIYWLFYIKETDSVIEGRQIGTVIDITKVVKVEKEDDYLECAEFGWDVMYDMKKKDVIAYMPVERPKVYHREE